MGQIDDIQQCQTVNGFRLYQNIVLGYVTDFADSPELKPVVRYSHLLMLLEEMYEGIRTEIYDDLVWKEGDKDELWDALNEICCTALGRSEINDIEKGKQWKICFDDIDTWGDFTLEEIADVIRAFTMAFEYHQNNVCYFHLLEQPTGNVPFEEEDTLIQFSPNVWGITQLPHTEGKLKIKKPVFLLGAMQLYYEDGGFTWNQVGYMDIWSWLATDDQELALLEFVDMLQDNADEADDSTNAPILRMWFPDIRQLRKNDLTDEYIGRALANKAKIIPIK